MSENDSEEILYTHKSSIWVQVFMGTFLFILSFIILIFLQSTTGYNYWLTVVGLVVLCIGLIFILTIRGPLVMHKDRMIVPPSVFMRLIEKKIIKYSDIVSVIPHVTDYDSTEMGPTVRVYGIQLNLTDGTMWDISMQPTFNLATILSILPSDIEVRSPEKRWDWV